MSDPDAEHLLGRFPLPYRNGQAARRLTHPGQFLFPRRVKAPADGNPPAPRDDIPSVDSPSTATIRHPSLPPTSLLEFPARPPREDWLPAFVPDVLLLELDVRTCR